jgi:hypothetical protein
MRHSNLGHASSTRTGLFGDYPYLNHKLIVCSLYATENQRSVGNRTGSGAFWPQRVPGTAVLGVSRGDPVGETAAGPRSGPLTGPSGARWGKMGQLSMPAAGDPSGRLVRAKLLTNQEEYDPRATTSGSRPISRVLSWATIHLGRASPRASSDLPGSLREPRVRARRPACFPIWSCSRWGFPCRRVLPPTRCALTAPFHPYRRRIAAALRRSALCCTFRGLAPPRRYLAPCSMEPGLSSAKIRSGCLADSRAQYTGRAG